MDDAQVERKARAYAARLLRYRPRSTAELTRRLASRGISAATIRDVVERLTAAGALNDRQFALWWARTRAQAHRGSRAITLELERHDLARPLIAATLTALAREHDEPAAARQLIERRAPRYRHLPPAVQWRRLGGQLARRGFPAELIEDMLHQCLAQRTPH